MSVTGDAGRGAAAAFASAGLRARDSLAAGFSLLLRKPRRTIPLPVSMQPHGLFVGALGALFVIAWTAVWWDRTAITAARRLPSFIVALFGALTDFGKSGWFLFPAGIGILVLLAIAAARAWPKPVERNLAALAVRLEFVFLAIGVPGAILNVIKGIIGRARPFPGGEADPFVFHPFTWSAPFASMPSGHAATAFGALVAFGSLWPKARPWLWGYAVVIAISRVVVGAHHPSDVIAGALIGAIGALLVRNAFAARRLVFKVNGAGEVMPMAGPSVARLKTLAEALRRP